MLEGQPGQLSVFPRSLNAPACMNVGKEVVAGLQGGLIHREEDREHLEPSYRGRLQEDDAVPPVPEKNSVPMFLATCFDFKNDN